MAGKTRVSRNGLSRAEKPAVLRRARRLEKEVGVCWEKSVESMKSRDRPLEPRLQTEVTERCSVLIFLKSHQFL